MLKEKELLYSVEDKYIKNEIDSETYKRWVSTYKDKIDSLEFAVMRLEKTDNEAFTILDRRLDLAGDVKYIYSKSDTLEKREFLDLVFDSNLYYEKGIYRTPTMMGTLSHNILKMKYLRLLIMNKKRENFSIPPPGAPRHTPNKPIS